MRTLSPDPWSIRTLLLAFALASSLVGCGENDAARRAGDATPDGAVGGTPAITYTGTWTREAVIDRLEDAGLVPRPADSPTARHEFFSVPGERLRLADTELQLFIYPDSVARAHDTAALDTQLVVPPGVPSPWTEHPTLIVSNNLAAVLLGGTARHRERVRLALEAGLPRD